jgi:VanZ family protein
MKFLRRFLQVALIAYWLFALIMTHIPKPPPIGPEVSDKLIHFLAYGLLGGLLFLTMWITRPQLRYLPPVALAILIAYAAFDELTQPLFGRAAGFDDWLADCAGALVAVAVLGLMRQFIKPPDRIAAAKG